MLNQGEKQASASSAREVILGRIRAALQDVSTMAAPEEVGVERTYLHAETEAREAVITRFMERVADYQASVQRIQEDELPATISAACQRQQICRLVVPADLPAAWIPVECELLQDHDQALTYAQLDESDGVLTGCALGIAQTGTIVLDGGTMQGRRVLSLLPDYALCLIWEEQIVSLVPEAITKINQEQGQRRPLTFISGPSATSDIELNRVEGVHGPRTLEVLVVRRVFPGE